MKKCKVSQSILNQSMKIVREIRRENVFPDALYLSVLKVRSDHHGFPAISSWRF